MADDKPMVHVDHTEVRPEILDHQVQECPTCKGPLFENFGLAGGGFGPYGFCEKCERVVWKCSMPDDES